eukprot:CAMPEP_0174289582 /NCGR_PEP_ID=MMETSP0809-20121228/25546_1 /TAXON_ID=73025 ORGANISM="Eutreptiella gymnastica-like, Strain CCMP1594" /NCGR_SAMPLE_ID=MMETSP0809 /ASSEMBLY_ACC=CAM_ASM_000658 /LENGTH=333 /DNA_ID=CAMNT_0015387617 /DNA_START=57 /DNA_END=1058 /DNA_ORIENTATION=-
MLKCGAAAAGAAMGLVVYFLAAGSSSTSSMYFNAGVAAQPALATQVTTRPLYMGKPQYSMESSSTQVLDASVQASDTQLDAAQTWAPVNTVEQGEPRVGAWLYALMATAFGALAAAAFHRRRAPVDVLQPLMMDKPLGWAMSATYSGTDIEIDATGVSFPIKAECPIGEAGKACDGSESKSGVTGMVEFEQKDAETITIKYKIEGLAPGDHGFHIHEKADFSNGCASAGPHWNPFGKTHGGPADVERHVGDLGNVTAGDDGVAEGQIDDKLIKLFGEYTVEGRSMMVHADPDDLGRGPLEGWPEVPAPPAPGQHTKTTGNAGARIACGVIKLV